MAPNADRIETRNPFRRRRRRAAQAFTARGGETLTDRSAARPCALCEQPITEGERWEYERGAYPVGTSESAKRRVHSRCVAALIREALELFARVPEDERETTI